MLDIVDPMRQRADYTFKFNRNLGRHGWLRLTPAYSVKLVKNLMEGLPVSVNVLDPFSGTATTGLVAAEHGNSARTLDINPFLIWLGNHKCRSYTAAEVNAVSVSVDAAVRSVRKSLRRKNWRPPLFNIERWWSPHTLDALSALRTCLVEQLGEPKDSGAGGLAWIAFCRLIIETSSAAFNHQSMSFHDEAKHFEVETVVELYALIVEHVLASALSAVVGDAQAVEMDARQVASLGMKFGKVVTSPPYPNRMSYIRELRPYMYWMKFIEQAKEAGELDWKAIGGTWGIASSRLNDWEPEALELPRGAFSVHDAICGAESKNGKLLGTYVLKYFHDMHQHLDTLRNVLEPGADLHYVVGNSTFFGNMVDTAALLEESFRMLGYHSIHSDVIRKRNSKKELFEYCVNAKWG